MSPGRPPGPKNSSSSSSSAGGGPPGPKNSSSGVVGGPPGKKNSSGLGIGSASGSKRTGGFKGSTCNTSETSLTTGSPSPTILKSQGQVIDAIWLSDPLAASLRITPVE